MRQSEDRRLRNRYYHKSTRTAVKKLKSESEKDSYDSQLHVTYSMIDKLAKRNIIHQNKAARLKSKLAEKVNRLAHAR